MKNKIHPIHQGTVLLLLACLFTALCSGCVNLKPTADVTKQYALGSEAGALMLTTEPESVLYIARPNLPGYIEGLHLQYRSANSEVISLSKARWIEPLDQGIARTIGELLLESGKHTVSGYYPWPQKNRNAAQLKVNFFRFGGSADGQIELSAYWELVGADGEVENQGLFTAKGIEWQVGDAESLVAGLNQALVELVLDVGSL